MENEKASKRTAANQELIELISTHRNKISSRGIFFFVHSGDGESRRVIYLQRVFIYIMNIQTTTQCTPEQMHSRQMEGAEMCTTRTRNRNGTWAIRPRRGWGVS